MFKSKSHDFHITVIRFFWDGNRKENHDRRDEPIRTIIQNVNTLSGVSCTRTRRYIYYHILILFD